MFKLRPAKKLQRNFQITKHELISFLAPTCQRWAQEVCFARSSRKCVHIRDDWLGGIVYMRPQTRMVAWWWSVSGWQKCFWGSLKTVFLGQEWIGWLAWRHCLHQTSDEDGGMMVVSVKYSHWFMELGGKCPWRHEESNARSLSGGLECTRHTRCPLFKWFLADYLPLHSNLHWLHLRKLQWLDCAHGDRSTAQ